MSVALGVILSFASVVAAGFVWGRISSRLPIPEWLRLATTPVWTGVLAVVAGWIFSILRSDWASQRLAEAGASGPFAIVRMALGYAYSVFRSAS